MRRTQKFLITSLVVAASVGLILWNTTAQSARPSLGVTDAKRTAYERAGEPVSVRGTILAPSVEMNGSRVQSFVIADAAEQLKVLYNQTPPENFGPKEVVINGELRVAPDGSVVLVGQSIMVGCSSKY